jgi:formate dehydrogenase maturation protein FdhE
MLQPVLDKRWSERRERARELAASWPFAAEVLGFYAAVLDVQERIFEAALSDRPRAEKLAAYAMERALGGIIEASVTNGPPAMTESVLGSFHETDLEPMIEAWLRGESLAPVERYLARAATSPILEALGNEAFTPAGESDERHCPTCGGLPQLSTFAPSSEDLVTARRHLVCSRCATSWPFSRMTCAGCGETETKALAVFGEIGTTQAEISEGIIKARTDPEAARKSGGPAQFPHMRIDGCRSCSRYLLNVDLERNPRAVAVVDEIAAIPLSLYAAERGLSKIVPNLMGF